MEQRAWRLLSLASRAGRALGWPPGAAPLSQLSPPARPAFAAPTAAHRALAPSMPFSAAPSCRAPPLLPPPRPPRPPAAWLGSSAARAGLGAARRLLQPHPQLQLLLLRRGYAADAKPMKVYKPTSPGQRGRVTTSRVGLWKGRPVKGLTTGLRKSGGRNNAGRITSRHRGGGAKRLYRHVDFVRPPQVRGLVTRLEYDPNRSARIALVNYAQGATLPPPPPPPLARAAQLAARAQASASAPGARRGGGGGAAASAAAAPAGARAAATAAAAAQVQAAHPAADEPRPIYAYILAPDGLKAGDVVASGPGAGVFPGHSMPLRDLPVGTVVHNLEMRPGGGGKLVRAAGTSATLVKKGDDGYATVRLASGETRLLLLGCGATVGAVGNKEHHNRKLGKAGASRHLGRRPHVRGVAMNPVDHPHGGGEGKTSGGRPSVTPWGRPTKGARTRNNKRTDAMRVRRREK